MQKTENRVLAKGVMQNNNSKETQLNNNDIIIGPSGAGKTTGYVIPNLLFSEESKIIVDTKSALYDEYAEILREKGYKVQLLDLTRDESMGYNMFEYIRYDESTGLYNDQDMMTISNSIVPNRRVEDEYWQNAARGLLTAVVALALEEFGNGPDTWSNIMKIYGMVGTDEYKKMFISAMEKNENSFAYKMYKLTSKADLAPITKSCIESMLSTALIPFASTIVTKILSNENRIDFTKLGEEKTALFVSISDMDRSKDPIYTILFTQAFQQLCLIADQSKEKALKIPVRIILDDFAANTKIEAFDKVTSVLRSRNVSVSIVLQSITQLNSLYSVPEATTIINNCDHMLYLGGQDMDTANMIASRLDKPVREVLQMPLDKAFLFERGSVPKSVKRFNVHDKDDAASIGLA